MESFLEHLYSSFITEQRYMLILHGLSILKIPRGLITNMNLRTLHQENIGIIKEQTIQINLILLTLLITKN